ncbi:hypothetical protein GUJ93_ZPchr0016g2607 [Zizania palustris]|uniref:Uncharacterized protein n=1 Tax=Zizania palustris TaxID=103762 RepID=A0A8J5VVP4_ZIZPA|nr:hypothetical protein GUJ93_ZPchr0016g2607 [Zizania palustris]
MRGMIGFIGEGCLSRVMEAAATSELLLRSVESPLLASNSPELIDGARPSSRTPAPTLPSPSAHAPSAAPAPTPPPPPTPLHRRGFSVDCGDAGVCGGCTQKGGNGCA